MPQQKNWRVGLAPWINYLKWLGLASFLIAFVDAHLFISKHSDKNLEPPNLHPFPTEGIAIYLLLDQSGSMSEEVPIYSSNGPRKSMTKISLLKQVTQQFVVGDPALGLAGRSNDLIGLISFARGAEVMSPLTLDHQEILNQLSHFKAVANRDEDGTAIGYAIYKAASLIAATRHYSQELVGKGKPAYTIKNSVIILVTDGLQDPNPLDQGKRLRNIDIPDAAAYAKQQGIRLYIVNVEPKITTEEFAPNRRQMQRAAEITGGQLLVVNNTTNLEDIYQEIDRLEKSELPTPFQKDFNKKDRPDIYRRVSLYPFLIALGLFFLLGGIILESTLFRRIP
ncbi:MAG: VWA domain-containing protein [Parachlamydiaceae bacterium]|nr:VWA domain-containing protein [Parachlamydiaceae bacterium]